MNDIWRVVSECVEKGVEDDVASGRQSLIAKEEIAAAKAEFEQAAAAAVGVSSNHELAYRLMRCESDCRVRRRACGGR